MMEAWWNTCTDPSSMLKYLREKVSDRKFRLFAVACCRSIWHLLPNEQARTVVIVAEQFADGLAMDEELRVAEGNFDLAEWDPPLLQDPYLTALASEAVTQLARDSDEEFAARTGRTIPTWPEQAFLAACGASDQVAHTIPLAQRQQQWNTQMGFIHCIFGNPFRPASVSPSWLAWNDGAVGKLAQVLYQEYAFDRLPLLADALEDAGCDNADILAHCREPGEHVRGCWVLDLVLSKK